MDVEPGQPASADAPPASLPEEARSADAGSRAPAEIADASAADGGGSGTAGHGRDASGEYGDGGAAVNNGSDAETSGDTETGEAGSGDAADGDAGDGDGDGAGEDAGKGRRKRKRSLWRELLVVVVAALVLTILIKAFLVQVFSIPSQSMQNTLQPGDRILVNRLVYHLRGIARGDIVVFSGDGSWGPPPPPSSSDPVVRIWDDFTNLVGVSAPGTDYVKRVIGLPGDRVMCCDAQGRVTVNGVPLNESSYLYPGDTSGAGDPESYNIVVPPGRLFVLGDHRSDSADSRYHDLDGPQHGTIPENEVVGRAFVIIWPPSRIGDLPIPGTFQQTALNAAAAAVNYGPAAGGASAATAVLAWRRRRTRDRE
jgi:signal peptidase I